MKDLKTLKKIKRLLVKVSDKANLLGQDDAPFAILADRIANTEAYFDLVMDAYTRSRQVPPQREVLAEGEVTIPVSPRAGRERIITQMEQQSTGGLIAGDPPVEPVEADPPLEPTRVPVRVEPSPASEDRPELVLGRDAEPPWGTEWWLWAPSTDRDPNVIQSLTWAHPYNGAQHVIGYLDRRNRVARMVGEARGFARQRDVLCSDGQIRSQILSMPHHTWAGIVNDDAVKWIEWHAKDREQLFRVDIETARTHAVHYDGGPLLGRRSGVRVGVTTCYDRNGYEVPLRQVVL